MKVVPLLDTMIALAHEASGAIMRIYAGNFEVTAKADASPVTAADEAAEAIIVRGLRRAAPSAPILAEEGAARGLLPALGDEFFLVDPLDGTREFISRNGEFTVNIALIRNGRPVMGVVAAPALGRLYAASRETGAFRIDARSGERRAIAARRAPAAGLVAVASRSHGTPETEAFLRALPIADFAAAGSSLKFCLVAEGAADVYPRLGRTMEWDTAAGQAILEAAGGRVVAHPSGEALRYGKLERGFDNPPFVAWGA